MEEASYRGVSLNDLFHAAAVCRGRGSDGAWFSATGEGRTRCLENGLGLHDHGGRCRRLAETYAEKHQITTEPGALHWAGVAIFRKTYKLYHERGYRVRLLSAAFLNHLHWSELAGGDVVISPPTKWQKRFNASGIQPANRIGEPVIPAIIAELEAKFPDYVPG